MQYAPGVSLAFTGRPVHMNRENGLTDNDKTALSIIVVNFRTPGIASDAVRSALADDPGGMEIIVVDNASSDDSVARLTEAFKDEPRVKIISHTENTGFAGGNNVGLKSATGDIVLFLNPDTIVKKGSLKRLMETLHSADDIGAVGGLLTNAVGEPVTSYGYFPTPMSMILTAFLPGRFYGKLRKALGVVPSPEEGAPYDVDYICGADLMVRGDVLREIGGMDSGYFMYFEETDLCRRIHDKGMRILYEPRARIDHLEGGSFGGKLTKRRMMFMKSSVRFFRKNGYSPFFVGLYHATTFIASLVKLCYFWLKYIFLPGKREETSKHIAWNYFIFPYYLGIGRKRAEA
jgi:N-acetylglucosaminyl-diphospho-decaprenol L-rhamnosyltransferase